MFGEVVYFILGFILGALIAAIIGSGKMESYEAEITDLLGQNCLLRSKAIPDENPESAYEQDREPGDDAIGVERDPFEGIEKEGKGRR